MVEHRQEELSKVEIKLRKRLRLLTSSMSERGALSFLKNRSLNLKGDKNKKKLRIKP